VGNLGVAGFLYLVGFGWFIDHIPNYLQALKASP